MSRCICRSKEFARYRKDYYKVTNEGKTIKAEDNGITFGRCECGIVRQINLPFSTKEQYIEFYRNEYPPTKETYDTKTYWHDRRLAKLRCDHYGEAKKVLDVGTGSGAFVDECREKGMEAYGCDISKYHYTAKDDYIYRQLLEDVKFPTDYFDLVTCHDMLEHTLDPIKVIKEMFRITKQEGRCIIDFPNFFSESGEHHWKAEHIWYFSVNNLEKILKDEGFVIDKEEYPIIKSKVIFYLTKPKQKRVKILVPPGIGDSFWPIVKLQSFLKREGLGIPDIYVACPTERKFDGHKRAFPFLEMFPFLNCTGKNFHNEADWRKKTLWREAYREVGRTIFKDVFGYDYFISYNGHLAHGEKLEEIDPDLECNWFPPMFVSLEQEHFRKECIKKYGKYMIFYFLFHGTYIHWTRQFSIGNIIKSVNDISKETGYVPVFAGAIWDKKSADYLQVRRGVSNCVDLTGQTTVGQLFGLIRGSQGVLGYPSGLTIMSAVLKQRTLIVWNDFYNKDFAWNSCPPSVRNKTYFATNTKGLTPQDFTAKAREMVIGKGE